MNVNPRILLVDDEEEFRQLMAEELRRQGFSIVEAGNGGQALALVAKEKFDLILADVRMPSLGGVGIVAALRGQEDRPPVILVTGSSNFTREDALKLGAVAFVQKPFSLKAILAVIQEVLFP